MSALLSEKTTGQLKDILVKEHGHDKAEVRHWGRDKCLNDIPITDPKTTNTVHESLDAMEASEDANFEKP